RCRGRRLITCVRPFAAKKWPFFTCLQAPRVTGQDRRKMVRIGLMVHSIFVPDRRTVLAALGAAALAPAFARMSNAEVPPPARLRGMAGTIPLRPGQAETPVWQLQPDAPKSPATNAALRLKRSDRVTITVDNDLPVPCVPYWRGMDVTSALAAVPPGG